MLGLFVESMVSIIWISESGGQTDNTDKSGSGNYQNMLKILLIINETHRRHIARTPHFA